jgi:hypothetical protein
MMELRRRWSSKKVNRSGLRATFRRWHPTLQNQAPSTEMRSEIWIWVGPPGVPADTEAEAGSLSPRQLATIDHAAVAVSLMAIAGDHEGNGKPIGAALQECDLSDLRLMRLLTTPAWGRLEALIRIMKRIDAAGKPIAWTTAEARRIHDFLFGNEDQFRRAVNEWASDFFRTRGRKAPDADVDAENTTETTSTN